VTTRVRRALVMSVVNRQVERGSQQFAVCGRSDGLKDDSLDVEDAADERRDGGRCKTSAWRLRPFQRVEEPLAPCEPVEQDDDVIELWAAARCRASQPGMTLFAGLSVPDIETRTACRQAPPS